MGRGKVQFVNDRWERPVTIAVYPVKSKSRAYAKEII